MAWKLYHEVGGLEKEYFLQDIRTFNDIIKRAYAILIWSNDQGKRVEALPSHGHHGWSFTINELDFFVIENYENDHLEFYWRFAQD